MKKIDENKIKRGPRCIKESIQSIVLKIIAHGFQIIQPLPVSLSLQAGIPLDHTNEESIPHTLGELLSSLRKQPGPKIIEKKQNNQGIDCSNSDSVQRRQTITHHNISVNTEHVKGKGQLEDVNETTEQSSKYKISFPDL
jgi:hypothetical protein